MIPNVRPIDGQFENELLTVNFWHFTLRRAQILNLLGAFILFCNNLNNRSITEKASINIILYLRILVFFFFFTCFETLFAIYHVTSFYFIFFLTIS